jgi:hypothetical protein
MEWEGISSSNVQLYETCKRSTHRNRNIDVWQVIPGVTHDVRISDPSCREVGRLNYRYAVDNRASVARIIKIIALKRLIASKSPCGKPQ